MSPIKTLHMVVGLGNPGEKYHYTRHNIGFRVVEFVAKKHSLSFRHGKGSYTIAKSTDVVLIKPTTFMNLSGIAVRQAVDFYQVDPHQLLIVLDDYAIPLGKLRLRMKGSSGGHNGLQSIIDHLGTQNFARLRVGIGQEFEQGKARNHVLSVFPKEDQATVEKMTMESVDGVEYWIRFGIEKTMNQFN